MSYAGLGMAWLGIKDSSFDRFAFQIAIESTRTSTKSIGRNPGLSPLDIGSGFYRWELEDWEAGKFSRAESKASSVLVSDRRVVVRKLQGVS